MRARSRAAKVALAVLAGLLVAASIVVVAIAQSGQDAQTTSSAKKRQGGHPPSRVVRAMCIHDGSKMLRYIRKPALCNEEEERAF